MSTEPLTREQAADAYAGGNDEETRFARVDFLAGWSARDAELARLTAENAKLRAACVAARDALHEATHELTNERCLIWCELAEKEVRAALAHKEPSDA